MIGLEAEVTAGPIVAVLSGGNVDLEPLFSALRG